jgi:hypothetical protein
LEFHPYINEANQPQIQRAKREASLRFLIFLAWLSIMANPCLSRTSTDWIEYLFPIPGSNYLPRETVIILRFKSINPSQIKNLDRCIEVFGEKSGRLNGGIIVSSDKRTLIFEPDLLFSAGETVSLRIHPRITGYRKNDLDTTVQFTVSRNTHVGTDSQKLMKGIGSGPAVPPSPMRTSDGDPAVINGVSIPSDFPRIDISVQDKTGDGYIFFSTTWDSPYQFEMIIDNTGAPIWYQKSEDVQQDLKVQPDGRLTMLLHGSDAFSRKFIALDQSYTVVDTFYVPEGYWVDEHELQVLPNGHYLLIGACDQPMDLSQMVPGGNPDGMIIVNAVIEMDAHDHPVFIWRSIDHFDVNDAPYQDVSGYGGVVDYVHMNAIELDQDGQLLISSRHLSEITKINRQTGEIIWRLGGENDDFTWINDEHGISYQHDIRVLDNGHYTVFDNGNFHDPPFSRALEFSVDTLNWTVTKIWEYPETHDIFSWSRGNVQRLPNGNTVICWANNPLPILTEVRPDGSKVFELDFVEPFCSYRSFRFPWQGKAAVPYLLTEPRSDGVMLIFNKFGDAGVAKYNVYGGPDPGQKQVIKSTTEPFVHLTELDNQSMYFFQVTATNQDGKESGFSNEASVFVNVVAAGENMVMNGDFSQGIQDWVRDPPEGGNTELKINEQGELHAEIQNGSAEESHCRIFQPNLALIQGTTYRFEFDAYTSNPRILGADILKNGPGGSINFSQIGAVWLTKRKNHYSYDFISRYSVFDAGVHFFIEQSEYDVFIDNVSLSTIETDVVKSREPQPVQVYMVSHYPNPFNQKTVIRYRLSASSFVEVRVSDVLGRETAVLVNQNQSQGDHRIVWDARSESSGVYICQIKAGTQCVTLRLILLK